MDRVRWLLMVVTVCMVTVATRASPLDDYVNRFDPTYNYTVISKFRGPNYTLYNINMTSQTWKSTAVLDRPVWWHYLSVTVPDVIKYKAAVLFIDGGSNHDGPPSPTDNFVALTTMLGASTGAVAANLKQIPNQPIVFKADPTQKSRDEDAVIAWTWKTFIQNTSDPEILLRMPMTKRGWTTWTTAVVDKRVVGIAPIVMDLLNMVKNLHHHFRAYGGWTFAFKDYYDLNFTSQLDNPNTQLMADIVDPISYDARLTMPKLVISTGGDEFFLPDDSHYYFNNLTKPTYLRILPDAEHSCAGHEISLFFTMRAFFLSAVTGTPLPKMNWTREATPTGGIIRLTTDRPPLTVLTFFAKTISTERRDFRLLVASPDDPTKPWPQPVVWHSRETEYLGNNTFQATFDNPTQGWLGFFIQVTFEGVDDGAVLEFTTESQIIPDTFPFPECSGASCFGTLV